MSGMNENKKVVTLTQNSDFRRAYTRGKSMSEPALVVYYLRNRVGYCRIGITTSKKIGNAVERNRCRRVILEAYRTMVNECFGGWDLVFVARFRTKNIKSTELARVMHKQLNIAGVIRE